MGRAPCFSPRSGNLRSLKRNNPRTPGHARAAECFKTVLNNPLFGRFPGVRKAPRAFKKEGTCKISFTLVTPAPLMNAVPCDDRRRGTIAAPIEPVVQADAHDVSGRAMLPLPQGAAIYRQAPTMSPCRRRAAPSRQEPSIAPPAQGTSARPAVTRLRYFPHTRRRG
jgi:hypothetical protein